MKNNILKGFTFFMAFIFLLSACALDSESYIPVIICVLSGAYLTVFAYVNGYLDIKR